MDAQLFRKINNRIAFNWRTIIAKFHHPFNVSQHSYGSFIWFKGLQIIKKKIDKKDSKCVLYVQKKVFKEKSVIFVLTHSPMSNILFIFAICNIRIKTNKIVSCTEKYSCVHFLFAIKADRINAVTFSENCRPIRWLPSDQFRICF